MLDFLLQTITASHTKIKFKAGASVRGGCRRRRRSTRSRHADHRLRHLDRLLSSGFRSSLSMREESLCRRQGDSTIRADTRTPFRRVQLAWHGARRSPAQTAVRGALTLFPHRHWSFNSELWLSLPRPYPAQLNRSIAVANATSRSVMRLPASCVFSRSTTRLYTF